MFLYGSPHLHTTLALKLRTKPQRDSKRGNGDIFPSRAYANPRPPPLPHKQNVEAKMEGGGEPCQTEEI